MKPVMITAETLRLIDRLKGEDHVAEIYASEAEELIDLLLEAQELYQMRDEGKTLDHIRILRMISNDMRRFAVDGKEQ